MNPHSPSEEATITQEVHFVPEESLTLGDEYELSVRNLVESYAEIPMTEDVIQTFTVTGVPEAEEDDPTDPTDPVDPSDPSDPSPGPSPDPEEGERPSWVDIPTPRVYGQDRYETSLALIEHIDDATLDTVFLATGQTFPDALAGGSVIQVMNGVVLLVNPAQSTSQAVLAAMERMLKPGGQVILLGGTSVFPRAWETQLSQSFTVSRIAGQNRQATAIAVADQVNPDPQEVILTTGNDFADALSIVAYANKHEIPIILNRSRAGLDNVVQEYFVEKSIQKVTIIGGEVAVSAMIEQQLQALGMETTRVAGQNRFLMSLAIIQEFYPEANKIGLVSGLNFPDGLSAGRMAYDNEMPLLLVRREEFEEEALHHLRQLSLEEVMIFGGPVAISDDIFEQ